MRHFNEDFAYSSSTRLCPICHDEFKPVKHNQVYCTDCQENCRTEIRRRNRAVRKTRPKRSISRTKSIQEIMDDLNDYNERHGTLLSYGKYVQKLENGTLKD